ncbi:hypothetical protein GALMADRAFT_1122745 [Galerina marginata CBS 339.88]|uniref:Uncharacterized protein n=1 Tax=Galerina marginata (strain CBS 339.88) TaxID=685588 RepID=A0A067TMK3_GALM3|nr:hypothetical protein GALMADRAFT_1122745 [Galerina marginata CBS 339.88]
MADSYLFLLREFYIKSALVLLSSHCSQATQVILNLRRAAAQEDTLSGILLKETGQGPKFAHATVESGLGIVVNRTGASPDRFEA